MSGSECCALVVEPDPGLWEIFEFLLEGWTIRFVQEPWAVPGLPPTHVGLLVIDEDYAERSEEKRPEWLDTLIRRVPTIVLRAPAAPFSANPSLLVLSKPFPVSLFSAFADTVRQEKARAASPPEIGP